MDQRSNALPNLAQFLQIAVVFSVLLPVTLRGQHDPVCSATLRVVSVTRWKPAVAGSVDVYVQRALGGGVSHENSR